jgi:hypothetical protein
MEDSLRVILVGKGNILRGRREMKGRMSQSMLIAVSGWVVVFSRAREAQVKYVSNRTSRRYKMRVQTVE